MHNHLLKFDCKVPIQNAFGAQERFGEPWSLDSRHLGPGFLVLTLAALAVPLLVVRSAVAGGCWPCSLVTVCFLMRTDNTKKKKKKINKYFYVWPYFYLHYFRLCVFQRYLCYLLCGPWANHGRYLASLLAKYTAIRWQTSQLTYVNL